MTPGATINVNCEPTPEMNCCRRVTGGGTGSSVGVILDEDSFNITDEDGTQIKND